MIPKATTASVSLDQPFQTIANTARKYGISTYELRRRFREGSLPHLRCGRKILVDTETLLNQLRDEANRAVK